MLAEGSSPVPGRTVSTRRLDVHLRELGEGPPVLLVHGFPLTSHMWRHQQRALADAGYRTLAYDTRGYGGTDKPGARVTLDLLAQDVVDLIDALDLPAVALVGHDWGGMIAAAAALRRPERFTSLAVLDSPVTVWPPYGAHGFWFKAYPRAEAFFATYVREFVGTVVGGRERTYGGPPETPWRPIGQAGTLSLAGRAGRPSFLSEQDVDHYVDHFAQPASWWHAISYYRNAVPFHRPLSAPEDERRYEHVDLAAVTEMWEHPQGLAAHPEATGWWPVYDPEHVDSTYDERTLFVYSRALLPAAFVDLAPDVLPASLPDVPLTAALRAHFPQLTAEPVLGGHFMPEEEAQRVNELLLQHLAR